MFTCPYYDIRFCCVMAACFDLFVPHSLLNECSSDFVFGCIEIRNNHVLVCCVLSHRNKSSNCIPADEVCRSACRSKLLLLGTVHSGKKSVCVRNADECTVWFEMRVSLHTFEVNLEKFVFRNKLVPFASIRVIIFTPGEFVDSRLLLGDGESSSRFTGTFVDFVVSSFSNVSSANKEKCLSCCYPPELIRQCSVADIFASISYFIFINFVRLFGMGFHALCLWWPNYLKKLLLHSALFQQLHQRILLIDSIVAESHNKRTTSLCSWNIVFATAVDILCGMISMHYMWDFLVSKEFFYDVMDFTNNFVNWLQDLIFWLMGDPAGLKLNIPLNTIIGQFFLYHIHLWKTYITVIRPIFATCLNSLPVIGVFGFTFFLSSVSDLLSLVTIHIYCFYGYMARLYYYHLCSLSALWRLFRGKKWNPEIQRVESYTFDIHQLYVGTLLFTVLVFLLPTVLVYYFVFATLRILVLTMQGIVSRTVRFLTVMPVYVVVLRILNSTKTTGDVYFSVLNQAETCILLLQVVQSSFSSVISQTLPKLQQYEEVLNWREFLSYLANGRIIYPV